jgi:desulfoferrodoxin-like iron-binding protein
MKLGGKYRCELCGQSVVCVVEGSGTMECCGQPMAEPETTRLPPSD